MRHGAFQDHMRIDADELALVIGIAVAGARRARLDVAHHRTGIAADLVGGGARRFSHHVQASGHCGYHSYTNDGARAPDSCQAAVRAKSGACRIKPHLPPGPVHKAGNCAALRDAGLHVCIQTVSYNFSGRRVART